MTQLSVMELAKQGDPNAIAALINRSLTSKGIHASAELESHQCLKISLQASQVPSQKAIVTIIHRGMMVLQVEQLQSVKIFTYWSDNNYLAWQYEIILKNNLDESFTPQMIKPADSGQSRTTQDQEMNLVKNSSGILLVQKLSQIQQNLQEYQDVIVRFTDEQMGNVRCLTTLTELIQVISKPSFLFATVASNPNLRSLLDTIAESSKTDEHGDQVITNLSILQPGQQWQKAKVRLVSKIFLEPAEDEQHPEDKHQGLTLDLTESEPEEIEPEEIKPEEIKPEEIKPEEIEIQSVIYADDHAVNNEVLQNNSEDFNRNPEPLKITTESLFDEFDGFAASPLSTSQVIDNTINNEVIDDVTSSEETEIADWSKSPSLTVNSLFDDFPEIATNNYGSADTINDDVTVRLVDDETVPLDEDQDLFNNFDFAQRSPALNPSSIGVTEPETALDVIRSKIPKQNLDELMLLMNQEDNLKTESQTITSQATNQNATQLNADISTATMERILGETGKHNVNSSDSKDSSTMVTLEDFWGD